MKRPGKFRDEIAPEDRSPLAQASAQRSRDSMALVERALRRKEVMLAFQPVMSVRGGARPDFYEGLIRVLDEAGRIIPAQDFMSAVEEIELGRIMDCLALEMGLDALGRDLTLRLAINMSARSIAYPRWNAVLAKGLRGCPTAGERLILEIAEQSAIAMPEITSVFMRDLQRRGISFALDDFGAGLTSFHALKSLLFDVLKIDGRFVRGIAESADNQCMMRVFLAFAREFDLLAVAESVETAADARVLAGMGVDCMQGYYFGAPTVTPPWAVPKAEKRA